MRLETRPMVGLDFGTTTTMVALADGMLPIGETMPSMRAVARSLSNIRCPVRFCVNTTPCAHIRITGFGSI